MIQAFAFFMVFRFMVLTCDCEEALIISFRITSYVRHVIYNESRTRSCDRVCTYVSDRYVRSICASTRFVSYLQIKFYAPLFHKYRLRILQKERAAQKFTNFSF